MEEQGNDVNNTAMKIERAKEVYKNTGPRREEVWSWYLYELCTYFIHTTLLPLVFPLMISQVLHNNPPQPYQGWDITDYGIHCPKKQMQMYQRLIYPSIKAINTTFSPLEWTSISWGIGLIVSFPILVFVSKLLDHGNQQIAIAGAATVFGSIFCLPVGFFKANWIFSPYITVVVVANIVAAASHTRHLGLIIRGFTGPTIQKHQFPDRRKFSSWLTCYATIAGGLGSALISAFTYHMLRESEQFLSLWVVSIFSGLKWLIGIFHIIFIRAGATTSDVPKKAHFFSVFAYPHVIGALVSVFLSSFATMCIFSGVLLHLVGQLCHKPTASLLYFGLTYFIFPLLSLPILQSLQHVIKANSVRMKLLGFIFSTVTSGFGFYYHNEVWERQHVLVFAAIQGTSVALLHGFGRVLVLDCAPIGKEGAFSSWYSMLRSIGTCAGFAVATTRPKSWRSSLGIACAATIVGMCVLVFGNVSDYGGAVKARIVNEEGGDGENGSPVQGIDDGVTHKEEA